MDHVEWKCTLGWEKCNQCNYDSHWELFMCAVCGGAEGTLPSECPGRLLTQEEEDGIYHKGWNFKNDQWMKGKL